MQICLNDVIVNDTPKFLCRNVDDQSHALIMKNEDNDNEEFVLPLELFGVISGFITRKATVTEFENCPRYVLTFEGPEYDPSSSAYEEQEEAMIDFRGKLKDHVNDNDKTYRSLFCISIEEEGILDATMNFQNIKSENFNSESRIIAGVTAEMRTEGIDAETLSKNWGIGLGTAKKNS